MAQSLGTVTKREDGNYEGVLSMGLNARIKIVANDAKQRDAEPDYRVYSAEIGEIGGGWNRIGKTSGEPYLSLTLAHPLISARKVFANLGRMNDGAENAYAILWNARA